MSEQERSGRARAAADAVGASVPIDIHAEAVNTDVIAALGRWRHVDPQSLHDLSTTLWTKNGIAISDSPSYLHALHGFVAEKVVFDDLSPTHHVVWPEQTNVPALDMIVDGTPTQIKEGTTAFRQVRHAKLRYPHVTSFITDKATAERLQAHDIDASGVEGLEPSEIAKHTHDSVLGLQALEHASQLHIPLLTSVFAICRYWNRFDAGKIDMTTALTFMGTDIAAQSIGAAAGLKLAAIYVVATGGFGIAALPLTGAAMVGALGLRKIVNDARGRRLKAALENFDIARSATEAALDVIVEKSRDFARLRIENAYVRFRELNADAIGNWNRQGLKVLEDLCSRSSIVCRDLTESSDYRVACGLRLAQAFADSDLDTRLIAIYRIISEIVLSNDITDVEKLGLSRWLAEVHTEFERVGSLRKSSEENLKTACLTVERAAKLDLYSEYALLVHRLARASEPTAKAFEAVVFEAERIGVKLNNNTLKDDNRNSSKTNIT